MNIRSGLLMLALVLTGLPSFAATPKLKKVGSSADYVTEAGIMVVKGRAAADLYAALNAKEVVDPQSTKFDQSRMKSNKLGNCTLSFYRSDSSGETEWLADASTAECHIRAPKGSVSTY